MITTDTMTEERRGRLDEFAAAQVMDEQAETANLPVPVARQPVAFREVPLAPPRNVGLLLRHIKELAAAAGQDWYYRYPVKNRKTGRTDYIEGPSIKLANDVARLYGNCQVDCLAEDMGSVIMYHARFIDRETGFALTRPFQQRKGASKLGGDDDARRDDATFQIGVSKAQRNVVVNALQTICDFAFEEAKLALVDKIGRDIDGWRDRVSARLAQKIDITRVEAVVGRAVKDWLAADIARIVAMGKAVEEGMATWDESFPPLRQPDKTDEALATFTGTTATPDGGAASSAAEDAAQAPANAAPAADDAPDQAEATRAQRSAIDICVRLANNGQLTEQEKLEQLDNIGPSLDGCTEAFIKTLTKTAADVARGKMKAQDARRYLEGMVK